VICPPHEHVIRKWCSVRNITGSQSRTTGEIFPSLSKSKSHTSLNKSANTASETHYTVHLNAILKNRLDCSITAWYGKDEVLVMPPSYPEGALHIGHYFLALCCCFQLNKTVWEGYRRELPRLWRPFDAQTSMKYNL
jgi:hypothetical protein